jgi:hypothetical protein
MERKLRKKVRDAEIYRRYKLAGCSKYGQGWNCPYGMPSFDNLPPLNDAFGFSFRRAVKSAAKGAVSVGSKVVSTGTKAVKTGVEVAALPTTASYALVTEGPGGVMRQVAHVGQDVVQTGIQAAKVAAIPAMLAWDATQYAIYKAILPLVRKLCIVVLAVPRPLIEKAALAMGVEPAIPVLFCKAVQAGNRDDIVRMLPAAVKLAAALGVPGAGPIIAAINSVPGLSTIVSLSGADMPPPPNQNAKYVALGTTAVLLGLAGYGVYRVVRSPA